jgi:sulfur-carrier protein adenylyltransferase/sulfurtransferase
VSHAPLVAPGPPLSPPERVRYSRHLLLPGIGEQGQRRLGAARVLVVGAGGLGSPVLTYLAAAGVGTLGVVDDDVVEESNLQRQVLHGSDDVGRLKVASAADALHRANPLVRVVPVAERLTAANAVDLLRGWDVVVDGADNVPTRYLVADACSLLGTPEVWGAVYRFDAQVSTFWPGHGPLYRDLFPDPPPPGALPSCAEGGVLGAMCATVGSLMATEVVKLVTGAGEPLTGRLLVLDALTTTWREVRVRPSGRPPVTAVQDVAAACAPPSPPAGAAVGARELAALLAAGKVTLVDVRDAPERELVAIPGAVHVPLARILAGQVDDVPRDRPVVLHCKTGGRSAVALRALRERGFPDVAHLEGGVLAWVDEVDPTLPRY